MNFNIENLILHKKKFLSEKECNLLINYFEKNKNKTVLENCPEATTNINTTSTMDVFTIPHSTDEHKLVSDKIEKIINLYHNYTDKFNMFHVARKQTLKYSHMLRLMKYKKGAKIHPHTDHDPFVYGSCTFNLNNNYKGGEFCFFKGKKKLKLNKGDALIFPADFFWVHEVKPIKEGERYSVNCFLQSIPESVKQNIYRFKNVMMKNYKENKSDGKKYESHT